MGGDGSFAHGACDSGVSGFLAFVTRQRKQVAQRELCCWAKCSLLKTRRLPWMSYMTLSSGDGALCWCLPACFLLEKGMFAVGIESGKRLLLSFSYFSLWSSGFLCMLWKLEGQESLLLLRSDTEVYLKLSSLAILKLQMLKKKKEKKWGGETTEWHGEVCK